MWNTYLRYKSIFKLPERPWLEEWIQKEFLYDVLEFSVKFRKEESGFAANAQRYSIWKYDFDPERDITFSEEGFHSFAKFAKDTNPLSLDEFRKNSLQKQNGKLSYFAFGIEIGSETTPTRLKTYAGYRSDTTFQLPFIVRNELNLAGETRISKYDGYPTADPRIPLILRDVSRILVEVPFFYCVYVETGRLHFKSDPGASESAKNFVSDLVGRDSTILFPVSTLLEEDFQIEVITLRRSEIERRDIQNLTIYFRDKRAPKR